MKKEQDSKNTKQILVMDKKTMDKYLRSTSHGNLFDASTFIISYYGEGEKRINFSSCKSHVIQIYMDDVRYVEDPDKYYSGYHDEFIAIARFIVDAMTNGSKIICQCNAGVSRSAATAMAIKEFYYKTGHEIAEDNNYNPNPLFYTSITEALNEITNNH